MQFDDNTDAFCQIVTRGHASAARVPPHSSIGWKPRIRTEPIGISFKVRDMKKVQQGFTLIELMIVVAIIGILAAIAVPMYLDYSVRSQVAEGLNLSSGAKAAVTEYYQDRGVFPTNNAEAGVEAAANIQGNYVDSVTVVDDIITVQYGNRANAMLLGKTITLTADITTAGSVKWACASGGAIPDKHLPAACR